MAFDRHPGLVLRVLGPLEMWVRGEPVLGLHRRKARWLVALLAVRHRQPVSREELAGALWPEKVRDARTDLALESLRKSVAALRERLGPEASRLREPTPGTLVLDLQGAEVDVVAFDRATDVLEVPRRRPGPREIAGLREAVDLRRGPLLDTLGDRWVYDEAESGEMLLQNPVRTLFAGEREKREQRYLRALDVLAADAAEAGDLRGAVDYRRRAAAARPLDEWVSPGA
jgi:DNA-binding SARP family transcriptional activator